MIYGSYNDPACLNTVLEKWRAEQGWGVLAGIGLLVLVFAYLITGIRRKKGGEEFFTFKSAGGSVSILLRAVNEFVAKIGDEFAAILSLKPTVVPRARGAIDILLDVRVKAGSQIPELCQLLEERVRESVSQSLGISSIRDIKIHIRDIVGTPEPSTEEDRLHEAGV